MPERARQRFPSSSRAAQRGSSSIDVLVRFPLYRLREGGEDGIYCAVEDVVVECVSFSAHPPHPLRNPLYRPFLDEGYGAVEEVQ